MRGPDGRLDPDRLSFLGCLHLPRTRLPEYPPEEARQGDWLAAFVAELARERTEPRRDRINPRVVRIKTSKFEKKRQEHRGIKPLRRPFDQTIVPPPAAQPAARQELAHSFDGIALKRAESPA